MRTQCVLNDPKNKKKKESSARRFSSITRTNNTSLNTTVMAYVQVEADDVRIYPILLVLLQRLILVHSNSSRKGQKLSSSNVNALLAVPLEII